MVKKPKRKLFYGILAIILLSAVGYSIYHFSNGDGLAGQTFSVASFDESMSQDMVFLDFCTSEETCNSYLSQEGMPTNFLPERGYIIYCQNENCYFKKT